MSMAANIPQKLIAKGLGISVSAVSRLVQNGMPTSSVEEAAAWRLSRAKNRKRSHLVPFVDTNPDEYQTAVTHAERTEATEKLCYNVMLDAARTGDVRLIGRASRDYLQAVRMAEEAKEAAIKAAVAMRKLVPVQTFIRAFDSTLGVLLDRLRKADTNTPWAVSDAREEVTRAIIDYSNALKNDYEETAKN